MSGPPEKPSEILGALPRTRPQRRSSKRGPASDDRQPPENAKAQASAAAPKARARAIDGGQTGTARLQTGTTAASAPRTAQRARTTTPRPPLAPAPKRPGLVKTLVQAGAELAEIGLSVTARAVRDTVSRLPRP
jgi:hypothetical protein